PLIAATPHSAARRSPLRAARAMTAMIAPPRIRALRESAGARPSAAAVARPQTALTPTVARRTPAAAAVAAIALSTAGSRIFAGQASVIRLPAGAARRP